jgi:predicted nucleic acid-binding protein
LRVLVDTSVWADFFNNHPSPEQRALADLFTSAHEICTCGVVVAEVFQDCAGMRDERGWG